MADRRWDASQLNPPLRAEQPTTQPFAGEEVTAQLVAMACEDEYRREDVCLVSTANPATAKALLGTIETNAELISEEPEPELKHAVAVELALSVLMRHMNQTVVPFLVVMISLMLAKTGVQDECWSTFTYLFVTCNRSWLEAFCVAVSAQLMARFDSCSSECVKFTVFDNCGYMLKTNFVTAAGNGGFMQTVNWMRVPLDAARFGVHVARGAWHDGSSRFKVRRLFAPRHPRPARFRVTVFSLFMVLALSGRHLPEGADILARPGGAAPEPTRYVYMDPVLDVGTAAYNDVDKVLMVIYRLFFHVLTPASMVLCVGDQQSYHRMVWLKKKSPQQYDWLLMLPGEFHFRGNALMALHRLWFRPLGEWFTEHTIPNLKKTIKADWDDMEDYAHYDKFWCMVICALTAYLAALPDMQQHVLLQPHLLQRHVQGNATATLVVRFLFDFGFPYLSLRNALRTNDGDTIDLMWIITHAWFMATGKKHYAILCVYVTAVRYSLVRPLELIWTTLRTASLRGYVACNVAWDYVNEKMNKDTKGFVKHSGRHTRARLKKVAALLNAFAWMWPRFKRAIGRAEHDAYDFDLVSTADRRVALTAVQGLLPGSFAGLRAASTSNAFKVVAANLTAPWVSVRRAVEGGSGGGGGGRMSRPCARQHRTSE